jgi:Putative phage tail protein
LQDSSYGDIIPLIYGGAQPDGSAHGIRVAGNVIYLSDIRKYQTTSTERQGSGKRATSTEVITDNYEADIAIMFAGNETELLALYADTDIIYDIRPQLGIPTAFGTYEAEAVGNTLAGGAVSVTDSNASGGHAVSMGPNASLQFNNVTGNGAAYRLNFFYSSSSDISVQFTWSGASGTATFNDTLKSTGGVYALGYFSAPFALASGSLNSVKVKNLSSATLLMDKLSVSVPAVTGVVNPTPVVPPTYAHLAPPAPLDPVFADNPAGNYSIVPVADSTGMVTATVVGGAYSTLRYYSGTETQLPDPVIDAYWQTQFPVEYSDGLDVSPAYKGRSYIMLEKFQLTNYQRVPNFTAVLRSKSIVTAQAILNDLAVRSGALSGDYDFSALSGLYVRGMVVNQLASLKQIAAQTLQVRWGFDFCHRNGAVTTVLRGGAASYHVPPQHLGFAAQSKSGQQSPDGPQFVRVSAKLNDAELPRQWDVTAFDPSSEFMTVTRSWRRELTTSQTPQQTQVLMALSPDEVTTVATRLGETAWMEGKYAVEFALPHQYLVATPATVLEIDDGDTTYTVRVSERTGPVPGTLNFKGVFVSGTQYHDPVNLLPPTWTPPDVFFPPTIIGQFVETDYLTAADAATGKTGYYVGVASYEQAPFRGAGVFVDRGAGYAKEADVLKLATVGLCATTLAATNTGAETVDADIFGTQAPTAAFTDADIARGRGRLMVGSERLQYKTATQVGGYANRWRFSNLVNRAQSNTVMSGHASNERLILLDDALVFVTVATPEAGVARDHKFVAVGADIAVVPATSYTFQGQLFAPSVSNLRATRFDASNGSPLTVAWDKGGRDSSLGTSAKSEVYRVRVFNGSTLARTHYVETGYSEPVSWQFLAGTSSIASVSEDGTLSCSGDSTHTCVFNSTQIIYGDSLSHFTLGTHYPPLQFCLVGATLPCTRDTATNEIVAPDHYWQNGDQVVFNSASPLSGAYYVVNATANRFQISSTPGGSPVSLSGTPSSFTMSYPALVPSPAFCSLDAVVSSGVLYLRPCSAAFDSSKRVAVAGTACAIEVASGVVNFYVGDLARPVFTANVGAVRWPYQVQATVGQLSGESQDCLKATVDHTQARSFTYTRLMQTQDFGAGSIPSTVTVEVCQMFDGQPGLLSTVAG